MKALAKLIIVLSLVLGCCVFFAATVTAGLASLECNGKESLSKRCDKETGRPVINPWLEHLALPLSATLATFFGAAIGLAKTRLRVKSRFHPALRWGALVGRADDVLAVLQTLAGLVYFFGVALAFYYLYRDTGLQDGATDSPFTHTLIKSQGNAFVGILLGGFALALGVEPAQQESPTNPIAKEAA